MRLLCAGVTPYGVGVALDEDPHGELSGTFCNGILMTPEALFRAVWERLAFDGSPARFREAFGMVDAVYTVGRITAADAYNWKYRMTHQCPGHLPCGVRWCAYCGDLPPDKDTSESWNESNWKELHVDNLEAGKSLKL
jgi:hypothetical protein